MAADGWFDHVSGTPSIDSADSYRIEQHLTFLDTSEDGKLMLGACNLVDRNHSGTIWLFPSPDLPLNPEKRMGRHCCDSPVTAGICVGDDKFLVAEDSGMLVYYRLLQIDFQDDSKFDIVPERHSNPHDSWVTSISLCCGGEVITGGADMRINILEVERLDVKKCYYPAHGQPVSSVAASPDDSSIFVSASMDQTALLWDTRLPKPASALMDGGCGYTALAWKDRDHVAIGCETGIVQLFDLKAKKSIEVIPLQKTPIRKLAISKSGLLASCADSTEIRLWNFETRKMIFPDAQHEHNVVSDLTWCRKTDVLYSCGLDGNVFAHNYS